ncbi:MAG: flagellar filament capping protein FliD [Alistipes senegalensis]|nr:flagellar filament capping protein FliD [Oxalobacter formigenes]MCM1281914.1 flagellar filament capping protein FliD [Alistipes senegalensis]
MAISSLGVGSGLDLSDTLSQLMEVEKVPLQRLATKQQSYQTKLSAYSMVQSALSTFESAVSGLSSISKYQKTTATSSNEDIATISAGARAANGSYSLKVDQLAQSQKLVANGVADRKAAIGSGKITIDFGEYVTADDKSVSFKSNSAGVKTIDINESNNTLEGIRDAINAAGIGVTASIINDGSDTPYRLALTNNSTGKTQAMKITVEGDNGDTALSDLLTYDPSDKTLDAKKQMTETQAAQNAEFWLDGIKISKGSNSVSDAIDGVTLKLAQADKDKTVNLNVSRDNSEAKKAVEELVKAYNDLTTTLKDMTAYNADEKTASVLTGDSAVRSIQTALKGMLSQSIAGGEQGYRMLADVGITPNKEGLLEIDSSKLDEALEKNFDAFTAMFAEGGLSTNSSITFEGAEDYAKTGSFDVEVTQVATQGSYSFKLTGDSKGLDLTGKDAAARTMQVTVDGVTKSITLSEKNYANYKEFASEIQSRINTAFKDTDARVSAEWDEEKSKFVITSSSWGSSSAVKISETGGIFDEDSKEPVAGKDVEGTINGVAAIGKGQTLTGASGSDAYGIKLKVTGDESNIRGTVSFTQGFAYQFTQLAKSLQGENSAIQSRIDGVNKSIAQVEKEYSNYEERIAKTEEMYRKKFTNLDVLLAQLQSTSTYLTTQLASLSGLSGTTSK